MAQYKKHPVVAHIDLPDLTEIKSKNHYYGGYGLSERATLLFIQYNLLKCTPLQLPLYVPAQVHMLHADWQKDFAPIRLLIDVLYVLWKQPDKPAE